MSNEVRVARPVQQRLLEEARVTPDAECCGLLAGRDGIISAIYPAPNASDAANSYEIAPEDLFRLIRQMRARGLELLGIYHSHPAGENRPSSRDIERAYYPDAAYFILSSMRDAPQPIRAFSIRGGRAIELAIETV